MIYPEIHNLNSVQQQLIPLICKIRLLWLMKKKQMTQWKDDDKDKKNDTLINEF